MLKNVLESKMKLFKDKNSDLAIAMEISPTRLSAKKNGTNGAKFSKGQIMIIKDRYKLTDDEVNAIFFAQ